MMLCLFIHNFWPHPVIGRIPVPCLGIKPIPPALEGRALTTIPPGKIHHCFILTSALMPLIPLNGHLSFIDLLLLNAATWASLKHGE